MLAGRIIDDAASYLATIGAVYNDCTDGIRSVVDSNGEGHRLQLIVWSFEVNNYRGSKKCLPGVTGVQELQELQEAKPACCSTLSSLRSRSARPTMPHARSVIHSATPELLQLLNS